MAAKYFENKAHYYFFLIHVGTFDRIETNYYSRNFCLALEGKKLNIKDTVTYSRMRQSDSSIKLPFVMKRRPSTSEMN